MKVGYEPGWVGAFTREEGKDCFPNGSRVVKALFREGDGTPEGTMGTVLGSFNFTGEDAELDEILRINGGPPHDRRFYFIEWDNRPKTAVGTLSFKIRLAEDSHWITDRLTTS